MQTSNKAFALSSIRTALFSAVACASIALTGCATAPSSKVAATTQAEFYPQCYEPVKQLRSSDQSMTRSVATGAIAGGLMGALAGGLSSDSKQGRNALIGAAGGALAGGAVGYYTARQEQISNDRERLASYAGDVDSNNQEIDRSVSYASAAQNCYQREFTALRADRAAKKVSDAEGRQRLAEIVQGLSETNALLTAVDGRTGQNIETYTQAYEKDLQTVGVQRTEVVKVATTPKAPAATRVPQEAVVTEQSLQKAKVKREESRQVASRGQTMISDVCNNPDMGDWAPASCSKA